MKERQLHRQMILIALTVAALAGCGGGGTGLGPEDAPFYTLESSSDQLIDFRYDDQALTTATPQNGGTVTYDFLADKGVLQTFQNGRLYVLKNGTETSYELPTDAEFLAHARAGGAYITTNNKQTLSLWKNGVSEEIDVPATGFITQVQEVHGALFNGYPLSLFVKVSTSPAPNQGTSKFVVRDDLSYRVPPTVEWRELSLPSQFRLNTVSGAYNGSVPDPQDASIEIPTTVDFQGNITHFKLNNVYFSARVVDKVLHWTIGEAKRRNADQTVSTEIVVWENGEIHPFNHILRDSPDVVVTSYHLNLFQGWATGYHSGDTQKQEQSFRLTQMNIGHATLTAK